MENVVARGLVCRDGAGRQGDPFRYWLPTKEAQFAADIRCQLDDLHRAQLLSLPEEVRRAAEAERGSWDEEGREE